MIQILEHKVKKERYVEPESKLRMIVNAIQRKTEREDESSTSCCVTVATKLIKTIIAR
jgi:hypothetical protein